MCCVDLSSHLGGKFLTCFKGPFIKDVGFSGHFSYPPPPCWNFYPDLPNSTFSYLATS